MADHDRRWAGMLMVLASALAFSTAGFFTRLLAVDAWTILFWRGVFGGIFIGAYVVWQERGRTLQVVRAIGWAGLAIAACSGLATICFINAFRHTTVADVTLIFATAPFVTGAIAWAWYGERENWQTLAASGVALLGVAMMFGAALSAGNMLGNLLALAMTLLMSLMIVLVRRHRDTPMLPAAALSAFLAAALVLPLAHPFSPWARDFFYLLLFGTTQFGLGLLLLTLGSRLISPTQSALLNTLETPLAPLWVWLGFGEVPPLMTCLGGAVVMLAVLGEVLLRQVGARGRRRRSLGTLDAATESR